MFTVYLEELTRGELIKVINALRQDDVRYDDLSYSIAAGDLLLFVNVIIPSKSLEYSLPKLCSALGMEYTEIKWTKQ